MYRTTRKFAWWPKRVWKSINPDPTKPALGNWVKIWLREYWIVEKANIVADCGGIYIEVDNWQYYVGDYYSREYADNVVKDKNKL